MKDRKTDTIIYRGLGIPVKLIDVPMKKVFGEWAIDIDFNELQLVVFYNLLSKPTPLNGDELRYIRKFLEFSITDWGRIFGVTQAAVVKWENGKTPIPLPVNALIRLYASTADN